MNLLQTGSKCIESALLPLKIITGEYRPSNFNYFLENDGCLYLFNTLSRRLAAITQEEKALLEKKSVMLDSSDENQAARCLVEQRFLVPASSDEDQQYLELYTLVSLFESDRRQGYTMYDILPTTDCNARCFYCFENGVKIKKMDRTVADQVVAFIQKTKMPDTKINLSWFGGEPLCELETIHYICSEVSRLGIPFYSTMITNGYLWTPELVKVAKEEWKLDRLQITLDGYGEEHNKRKAFLEDDDDPFQTVIRNIHLLVDAGIGVGIRLNMDLENMDSIKQTVYYLIENFSPKDRISIKPSLISEKWFSWEDQRSNEQQRRLREMWFELRQTVFEAGFTRFRAASKTLRLKHCMANASSSVTIQPDGTLYTCQTGDATMYYGNVRDGVTEPEVLQKWSCNTRIPEKCKGCTWLPECTAFEMCPAALSDCKIEAADNFKYQLMRTIRELSESSKTP